MKTSIEFKQLNYINLWMLMAKWFTSVFCTFLILQASAQLNWQAKSSMPDRGRHKGIAFTINGKIYCGLGTTGSGAYLNDFWEYNPITDVWTEKANFPGDGRYGPSFFAIGGRGYVCMGYSSSGAISSNCYSYNPLTDSWSSIASFPGSARYAAESFVIDRTAYIACGNGGGRNSYKNDLWSYNPIFNRWSQLADFPGGNLDNVTAFTIGGYGYVGAGNDGAYNTSGNFWRYNPATNSWSSIAKMPEGRTVTTHFVLNNKAYVGLGYSYQFSKIVSGFYEYNPQSDSWSTLINTSSNITPRTDAEPVTLGDSIYLMVGWYGSGVHTSLHLLQESDTNTVKDTIYTYIDTCYNNVDDTLTIYASGEGSGCKNVLMQVYPNPTATYLHFYLSKPECFSGSSLELVDQLGRILQTHSFNGGFIQMDIRGYARALYYLRLKSTDGSTVFSKKIIIQ